MNNIKETFFCYQCIYGGIKIENILNYLIQINIISAHIRPTVGFGPPPLWERNWATIPHWSDRLVQCFITSFPSLA